MKNSHIMNNSSQLSAVGVFVAAIPQNVGLSPLVPPERESEVASCGNAGVRRRKRFVWQLLCHALQSHAGISPSAAGLRKTDSGKWVGNSICFSLSHTAAYVAVALSPSPVGVDIEELPNPRLTPALYNRIACPAERLLYGEAPSCMDIARLWTAKESAFKCAGGAAFVPRNVDTSGLNIFTRTCFSRSLVLSVCGNGARGATVYRVYAEEDFKCQPVPPEGEGESI